jgi:hypothetical protein
VYNSQKNMWYLALLSAMTFVGAVSYVYRKKIKLWLLLQQPVNCRKVGNLLVITYSHLGEVYHATLKYNPRLVADAIGKKVFLITKNGERIDVTQQPGAVYAFEDKDFDGTIVTH